MEEGRSPAAKRLRRTIILSPSSWEKKRNKNGRRCPSTHLGFVNGRCIRCWEPEKEDAAAAMIPLAYRNPTLKLSREAIDQLRRSSVRRLSADKKLVLVLDLDHTLLHTKHLCRLSPQEDDFLLNSPPIEGLYRLDDVGIVTKLRPSVHDFLKEASQLFEAYVYTMGDRVYAEEMARILDPERVFLKRTMIISRDDCTTPGQKGLDIVPCDERLVVILDDSETVWRRHRRNLIKMRPYKFFPAGSQGKSCCFSEEWDGFLAATLQLLKRLHAGVYDPQKGFDLSSQDVGHVLKEMRQDVLHGCNLVFPADTCFSDHRLVVAWRTAEELGATCGVEMDVSTTTHVVSSSMGDTAHWALQHKRFLVTPEWINAASELWRRPPEKDYGVAHFGAAAAAGHVVAVGAESVAAASAKLCVI